MIRAFSFGGGVQSTAALVLAAEGKIDFPLFIFANVGTDSENPDTLTYLEQHAKPYAAAHGIEVCEVQKRLKDGSVDTIVQTIHRTALSVPIPAYMGASGSPGSRVCTVGFKVRVIDKELRRRGATKGAPAIIGLGISSEEWHRMRSDDAGSVRRMVYPLIDLGLDRAACHAIITDAGLPTPPKSSCYFCPLHPYSSWVRLKNEQPDLYRASVALEAFINAKRTAAGKDTVSLMAHGKSLAKLAEMDQLDMFDDEPGACDVAGYCHV